jgi:hypothetical protein
MATPTNRDELIRFLIRNPEWPALQNGTKNVLSIIESLGLAIVPAKMTREWLVSAGFPAGSGFEEFYADILDVNPISAQK